MLRALAVSSVFFVLSAFAVPLGLYAFRETPETRDVRRAELQAQAVDRLDGVVLLKWRGGTASRTRRELGLSVDPEASLESARAAGALDRGVVPLVTRVDRTVLSRMLEAARTDIDRDARPAELRVHERVATPHVEGRMLDLARSVDVVEAGLHRGDAEIDLVVDVDALRPDQRLPDGLSLDHAIATFETRYHPWDRSRSHNVELAARKLDGAIVPAGGVLSFNERVGVRSRAAGFRVAHVIRNGEITDGMGGGVCQVATTLFAAAYQAGLDPVEYQPHSRPSTYVPMGLDATVVWPNVDLQLRNPFDFPIAVHATAADGTMHVEILGRESPREVEIERRVVSRRRFQDRIVEDPTLPFGERVVSQEGIRGAFVERTRVVRERGEVVANYDFVTYPPTDRIIRVGTGAPTPFSSTPVGPLALR
jgi:vancomycin resistance protein YoaR